MSAATYLRREGCGLGRRGQFERRVDDHVPDMVWVKLRIDVGQFDIDPVGKRLQGCRRESQPAGVLIRHMNSLDPATTTS